MGILRVFSLYLLLRDNFDIKNVTLCLVWYGFDACLTDRKKARKLMGI